MQILALETSTDACSVALYRDGDFFVEEEVCPRQHSQLLLPMVQRVLQRAETSLSACEAIAFGQGPGSFTGVRMATGVAQGLAFGLHVPVIPVSTLAALAWAAAKQPGRYLATLDARMQELYWAVYDIDGHGHCHQLGAEQLTCFQTLRDFVDQHRELVVCGPGWPAYAGDQGATVSTEWPSARAVVELARQQWLNGKSFAPQEALPVYVRNEVVQRP